MGSFVSLLPHAPTENPTQAYQQGYQSSINSQQGAENLMQSRQMDPLKVQQAQQANDASALANQQAQRANAAQLYFNQKIASHVSSAPGGIPAVDYNGLIQEMDAGGFGSMAPSLIDQANAQHANALAQAAKDTAMLGSMAGSVTDENTKNSVLNQAVARGLLDPDHGKQLLTQPYEALKPQFAMWQAQAQTAEQQLQYAKGLNEFNHTVATQAPTSADAWMTAASRLLGGVNDQDSLDHARAALAAENAPDSLMSQIPQDWSSKTQSQLRTFGMSKAQQAAEQQKDLAAASQSLRGPASLSQAAYAAAYNGIDPSLQSSFPNPSTWDAQKTSKLVTQAGEAPNTISTADYRGATLDLREQGLRDREQADRDRLDRLNSGSQRGDVTPAQSQKDALAASRAQSTGYQNAETAYQKELKAANGDPGAIADATESLWTKKQEIRNAFEEQMEMAGRPQEHVDYSQQREAMRQKRSGATSPPASQSGGRGGSQTPQPAKSGAPAKLTEAQVRAKAKAAGKDPDAYVKAMRENNRIQ